MYIVCVHVHYVLSTHVHLIENVHVIYMCTVYTTIKLYTSCILYIFVEKRKPFFGWTLCTLSHKITK